MSHRTSTQRRSWKERALSLLLTAALMAGLVPGLTLPASAHWADAYLDQLVDAAEDLARHPSRPIYLPEPLWKAQNHLNQAREKAQKDAEAARKEWQEGKTDFYPASGLRERSTGALWYVGSVGYSWSSSPYSTTSLTSGSLHFNSSAINPITSNYCSRSFPVRCVKEK